MRSLSFLPLYAATVIAHASSHRDGEVCGVNRLLLPYFTGGPECSASLPIQPSLEPEDKEILAHLASGSTPCSDSTQCTVPSGHNWTFSSPCIKSISCEEEICVFTDSNFAQGRGISLLTTVARANFIASQPAFSNPDFIKDINQNLSQTIPANYKMKEIPGKGIGLEAIRGIKQGQLIMTNTPSLMIDYRSFEWLQLEQQQLLQTFAIKYLPDTHQAAIMQLSTHEDRAHMSKVEIISKITSTNSFDIASDIKDPVQDYKLFTLFPDISRLNHDCRPNAAYRFDHETMMHYIHAIRDIIPGEELTLSYTNPSMSRQERQHRLERLWGFKCACDSCMQNKWQSAESDDRIAQINSLRRKFTDYPSPATPAMAELLIDLYRKEDIWETIYLPYTYAALKYNGIGEPRTAIKYASMAMKHGLPLVGNKHIYMMEMVSLVDNPAEHWSFQMSFGEHIDDVEG